MIIYHLLSITLALLVDRLIGDPPALPHPVRWVGSLIIKLERRLNNGNARKAKGTLLLVVIGVVVFCLTFLLIWGAYHVHVVIGMTAEAVIIATTIAQNDLKKAAKKVYQPLKKGNIQAARHQVAMIVGRDTKHMNDSEITRATVETVAENVSDGITAPLFFALIGGAPFAMIYRAVNTCDSMVGYKNERYAQFGWASARFDDLLNWLPSRITCLCMIIGNKGPFKKKKQVFGELRQEAVKHPSPNSGWGEAAMALLLEVQLGGINYYQGVKSERAVMGRAMKDLQQEHILDAISIMDRSVGIFFILLWIGGGCYAIAGTWL